MPFGYLVVKLYSRSHRLENFNRETCGDLFVIGFQTLCDKKDIFTYEKKNEIKIPVLWQKSA